MNKIIKKEFIPYEQALALKQLGFDEPCFAYYRDGRITGVNKWDREDWGFHVITNKEITNITSEIVIAPTFSQCFRWFREKYGLFGYSYPNDYQKYGYRIVLVKNPENQELFYDWGTKDTTEEAELACLNKLIEILKNERS